MIGGFARQLRCVEIRIDLLKKTCSFKTEHERTCLVCTLRCYLIFIETRYSLRKEVIQPHLPIRLPCYDFVPLAPHTFGGWLLAVTPPTSGADNSGDVTGGVYKARERIHRSFADLRLLAIPASRRRVAACDPN